MPFYIKTQVQEMNPWTPETDMSRVSVSEADKENGSPKEGDQIAINEKDRNDQWLVAKESFERNYQEVLP